MGRWSNRMIALAAAAALTGCASSPGPLGARNYHGISTRLLDDEIVELTARLSGGRGAADAYEYLDCAAAGYGQIRGAAFVHGITRKAERMGDIWVAEGAFTVSPDIAGNMHTLDVDLLTATCEAQAIPLV